MRFPSLENKTQPRSRKARIIGLLALLLLVAACEGIVPGNSAKNTTELVFKGRCVDANAQGIQNFSLAVRQASSTVRPSAVNVTTQNGQYETRITVNMPTPVAGRTLGSSGEKVHIGVSAAGYKNKSFTVTADQVLVGEPNTLNVTLDKS